MSSVITARSHRGAALVFGLALALFGLQTAAARTLATAYGDVSIEGTPERIVTLHTGALDTSVALGFEPLAAVRTRGGDGVARYIQDDIDSIDIVGTPREVNIEAVVAQRPDIILASPRLQAEQYRRLSQIAPTFVPPDGGFERGVWRDMTRFYAEALGRPEQAERLIQRIADRADTLSQRVPADDNTAIIARWMPQGPMVMASTLFAGDILASAGFDVTDRGLVADGRPHSDPLSLENLARIDGDWLFLATLNEQGEDALADARQSPGFQRLEVVDNGRVVAVDGQLWSSAMGPLAAEAILDDIAEALDTDDASDQPADS